MSRDTALLLLPEIILTVAAVAIYLGGVLAASRTVWRWVAVIGMVLAAVALSNPPYTLSPADPVSADALAFYGRWLSLGVGLLLVLTAWTPLASPDTPEYLGSLLLTIVGLMLVAAARDLVLLFVGLELVSIPTYILLYVGRSGAASQESTAKYFYLSILASALFLYGVSFLYGVAGSTDLGVIAERVAGAAGGDMGLFVRAALVLVVAGLGFRITAVPFHFYAPDVYQGTSHANAGLLSVLPKIVGLVALVRLVVVAMPGVERYAWPVLLVLAILTMTVGNTAALWQTNVRRMMAYSSVAHAGYLLVGLAVALAASPGKAGGWDGIGALLFYLVVYAVATIGTFAALSMLGRGERQLDRIDELAGLAWGGGIVRPVLAWSVAVFMFSLAGLPPLAGFWGKLALFASSLSLEQFPREARPWFVVLAVIGVLNSVVSAAYYLRLVGVMFFRRGESGQASSLPYDRSAGAFVAVLACLVLAIYIGVRPGPWIREAREANPRLTAAAAEPAENRSRRTGFQPVPELAAYDRRVENPSYRTPVRAKLRASSDVSE